MNIMHCTEDP